MKLADILEEINALEMRINRIRAVVVKCLDEEKPEPIVKYIKVKRIAELHDESSNDEVTDKKPDLEIDLSSLPIPLR